MKRSSPRFFLGLFSFALLVRVLPYFMHEMGWTTYPTAAFPEGRNADWSWGGAWSLILSSLAWMSWYPWNVSPMSAVSLYAGATARNWKTAVLWPIGCLAAGDLCILAITGRPDWVIHAQAPLVYGCMVFTLLSGALVARNRGPVYAAQCGLVCEAVFFVITNGGVWALEDGSIYPKSLGGLAACYIAGLPYLKNSALGTMFYSGLLFSRLTNVPAVPNVASTESIPVPRGGMAEAR